MNIEIFLSTLALIIASILPIYKVSSCLIRKIKNNAIKDSELEQLKEEIKSLKEMIKN